MFFKKCLFLLIAGSLVTSCTVNGSAAADDQEYFKQFTINEHEPTCAAGIRNSAHAVVVGDALTHAVYLRLSSDWSFEVNEENSKDARHILSGSWKVQGGRIILNQSIEGSRMTYNGEPAIEIQFPSSSAMPNELRGQLIHFVKYSVVKPCAPKDDDIPKRAKSPYILAGVPEMGMFPAAHCPNLVIPETILTEHVFVTNDCSRISISYVPEFIVAVFDVSAEMKSKACRVLENNFEAAVDITLRMDRNSGARQVALLKKANPSFNVELDGEDEPVDKDPSSIYSYDHQIFLTLDNPARLLTISISASGACLLLEPDKLFIDRGNLDLGLLSHAIHYAYTRKVYSLKGVEGVVRRTALLKVSENN